MLIRQLETRNFRNLRDGAFTPCEGVNVIYGDNAQGKTNLLEAMWLFTGGHSFRGAKDSELIRLEGDNAGSENNTDDNAAQDLMPSFGLLKTRQAQLKIKFFGEGREQNASLNIENGRKTSEINGVKKKTGSALVGRVRAVIFSPEHLLLVKEGPGRRRSFIDGALCQIKPGFVNTLGIYNRALMQRNALLKDLVRFPELYDTLEVWDARLIKLGAAVMADRAAYVKTLAVKAESIYSGISNGRETLKISYSPSVRADVENLTNEQLEAVFYDEIKRTRQSDLKSGFTSAGPHRDDMNIELSGLSARIYASQGQQRSAVLALKLAEAEAMRETSDETPIVLLDDVMSELDFSRQEYLLNHLSGQVFITCCSPDTVGLQKSGKRFFVKNGEVTER